MSRTVAAVVTLLLSSSPVWAQVAQQPPRDQSQPPSTGTARIRGRVLAADDGRPLRRTMIRVTAPELREGRSTTTDPDGRYEVADLPAGRFTVTAVKAGFVTISHGQTRPNEMGRPIEIRDRQTADRIDFSLPRGAVITGRVVDEYGEPVANARVLPMQLRFIDGERQPMMAGSGMAQTPDTGEFRLWGLAPGEYLVQANLNEGGAPGDASDRSGYLATFYPGAPSAAEAQTVRVELGQTLTGIDIVLTPTRTARITGTTLDTRGQPLRSGFVNALQRSNSMVMMTTRGAPIRPDGTFTITGVTPGTYLVRASAPPTAAGRPPESLAATVTVGGDDVSGVVLMPLQPATLTGRLVFDPPTFAQPAASIRVMAAPRNPRMMMPMPMPGPIVNDDFTFEVNAAPGETVINAVLPGMDWQVKSVTVDGRDVTHSGLDLSSGQIVDNVEIVMTNRLQVVSGTVTNDRGEMAADVTVFAFAQDRQRWFGTSRFAASGRPDQNGRYTLRTLPPGDYYAIAVEYLDPNRRGGDPTYLDSLAERAVRFTLGEGETRTLDLKLSVLH